MHNKKAFTIVEIIISIVLIILVGTISIILLNKSETNEEKIIKNVLNAADVYYSTNTNNIKKSIENNYGYIILTIDELKNSGFLRNNFKILDTDEYKKIIIFDDNYLGENPFGIESEKIGDINYIYPYKENTPSMVNLSDIELYGFEYDYLSNNIETDDDIIKTICNYDLQNESILYFDKNYKVTEYKNFDCNINSDKTKLTYSISDNNIKKDRKLNIVDSTNILKIYKANYDEYDGEWTNSDIIFGYDKSEIDENLEITLCPSTDIGTSDCENDLENYLTQKNITNDIVKITDHDDNEGIKGKKISVTNNNSFASLYPIYGSYKVEGRIFTNLKKTIEKGTIVKIDKKNPTITINNNSIGIEDDNCLSSYKITSSIGNKIETEKKYNSCVKNDDINISNINGSYEISVKDKAGNETKNSNSNFSSSIFDLGNKNISGIYNNLLIREDENGEGRIILKVYNVTSMKFSEKREKISIAYKLNNNRITTIGNTYYIEESYSQNHRFMSNSSTTTWYNYYKLIDGDGDSNGFNISNSQNNNYNFKRCKRTIENNNIKENTCSQLGEINNIEDMYIKQDNLEFTENQQNKLNNNEAMYELIIDLAKSKYKYGKCQGNCDEKIKLLMINNHYPYWKKNENGINYYFILFNIKYYRDRFNKSYSTLILLKLSEEQLKKYFNT